MLFKSLLKSFTQIQINRFQIVHQAKSSSKPRRSTKYQITRSTMAILYARPTIMAMISVSQS